jgi:predicted kinase
MKKGTLVFFSGKMGAGKSTKSKEIALKRNAVLLSEDEWLESIYPDKISSLDDYIKYSNQLKPQIKKLVQSILVAGTDVVMDFPANTASQKEWFRDIFTEVDAPHSLIFIDVANEVCLKRIEIRHVAQPERAATDTVEMFERVTEYFVEPTPREGFNIIKVSSNA